MNVPTNCRKFDINLAQQNHPLVTRAGQPAKFIAYVPENVKAYKVVVAIDGEVKCHREDGQFYENDDDHSEYDLFLSPVGYCEGKPVFVSDKLISISDGQELIVKKYHNDFRFFKWPSKTPVVETRYTGEELQDLFADFDDFAQPSYKHIANKAIERAILDGDVIPTSVVKELADKAHTRVFCCGGLYKEAYMQELEEYLERLK